MAASGLNLCAAHLREKELANDCLIKLSESRFKTFLVYTEDWSKVLKEPEHSVAVRNGTYSNVNYKDVLHEGCDKRYTNQSKLKAAQAAVVSHCVQGRSERDESIRLGF